MKFADLDCLILREPKSLERPVGYRDAAVLVLTFEGKIYLTLRASHLNSHASQISFAGGGLEPDETPEQGALREAYEEIGLRADSVRIIGRLDPVLSPVGFRVFPVLGVLQNEPELQPDPNEVEEILVVPLGQLEGKGFSRERTLEGHQYQIWFYPWNNVEIWGLTGNIIHDLLTRIQEKK